MSEKPSDRIEGLPGPSSEMAWSADFVMQAIEILPVRRDVVGLVSLMPEHADSFLVGWPAGRKPEQVAAEALQRLGIQPIILHSTSWRHSHGEVVLTYVAVVAEDAAAPDSWHAMLVEHAELARGGAVTPPTAIDISQVLEHALRHLAWLMHDDDEVRAALPGWEEALAGYVPEPFRALGGPEG